MKDRDGEGDAEESSMLRSIRCSSLLLVTLAFALLGSACDVRKCDDAGECAGESESESDSEGEPAGDTEGVCVDGATRDCELNGQMGVESCVGGVWGACMAVNDNNDESITPLVLSFDGGAVRYQGAAVASFDLHGGMSVATDWPAAATPWLVMDRDGDGVISDGRELFGSMTRLVDGERARNGFEALAALDDNGDGKIDAADQAWGSLALWADHDGDRRSASHELRSVESAGLIAIGLSYRVDPRCDLRGNCEIERASFIYRDRLGHERVGEVVDVHLMAR